MTRLKGLTICFIFFLSLLSGNAFCQEIIQNDLFAYAPLFNNKVVLIKEIPFKNSADTTKNFRVIKEWGKERYASDPLVSDIAYDNINKEVRIKSKIELLLPKHENRFQERIVMTYYVSTFIFNGKCIFEASDITYKLEDVKKSLKAEDTITESAMAIKDNRQELKMDIQKSTLYFFNELANSLADTLSKGN